MDIPVIDLLANPADLAEALRSASCCWITSHGVAASSMRAIYAESLAFFDLPRSEKAKVEWPGTGLWRGWQPVFEGGAEYGGDRGGTELLERFEVNLSASNGGADASDNRWPDRPAGMRPAWTAYAEAMTELSGRLVRQLAESLDLPVEDVPAWTTSQFSNLVVSLYPEQSEAPAPGRTRSQPHVDHGGFTILLLDDATGGLEVATPRGWVPVHRREGALLVQAGELLERWTDGMIRGNRHRVVNPPPGAANARRQSVLFFHHPDLAAVVAPAPSCRKQGAGLAAVVAGELVAGRQRDYGAPRGD